MSSRTRVAELGILLWGTLGVVVLLVDAIVRLLPKAIEPLVDGSITTPSGLAYVAAIVTLAYAEGYRGFQQRFSPRVAARALQLARSRERTPAWLLVLAPLMTMGLVHATRKRLIASWLLLAMIVGFILLVALLDQPWRGAVDAGVVVGLSWGSCTIVLELVRVLRGQLPDIDPDLPQRRGAQA
jgi:hypothetical protein